MHLTNGRAQFSVFVTITILFVFIVIIWNELLGLFFQIHGGLALKDLLNSNGTHSSATYPCLRRDSDNFDQEKKLMSAVNSLERASYYNSSSAQSYLLLGRAYCLLKNYKSATNAYQKYTKLRPGNPLGHIELGFAYEALVVQDPKNPVNLLDSIENIPPEQLKDYWQKYQSEPAVAEWTKAGITADSYLNEGIYLTRNERYDDALVSLTRALWMQIDSAKTWLAVGEIYEEMGSPLKALKAYEAAYFFDPEIGATDLVNTLDDQEDFGKIESILKIVLQDYPESDQRYQWWDILSSILAKQNRWSDVENITRLALIENPEWGDFHVDLGWALYNQNIDWQVAAQEFKQAIEINEASPEGYFAMARLLTQEKRYLEADPYYVEAIERKPDDRWYQLNRAINGRSAGNNSLAVEIFDSILLKYPQYSRAYYEAALAYYLDGQLSKAKETIEQAISLQDVPDQWYFARAGAIFEGVGDLDQALIYYQHALELNPANSTARQGVARLGGK